MTRKLWMTIGTLTLFLTAGSAWATDDVTTDQSRKEDRKAKCTNHKGARQPGHSKREAKARAWRQIVLARATTAAADWQGAFEELAGEVLIVAAELSQSGSHKAAMNLLQRVLDAIPSEAEVAETLERIHARAPRDRNTEEGDVVEQECCAEMCYAVELRPAVAGWVVAMQEACMSTKASPVCCTRPAAVPCCPVQVCAPACDFSFPPVTNLDCKCPSPNCCGEKCQCGPACQSGGSAARHLNRIVFGLAPCCPIMLSIEQGCCPFGGLWTADACAPRMRVIVLASTVDQTDAGEVQEVTVLRFGHDGNASQRQYQVQRSLNQDSQSVARVERIGGMQGRFVHHVGNDAFGNYTQDSFDIVPCDE